MNESILNTIKAMLGAAEDYDDFSTDILIHINSALSTLTQLGVGPENGYRIADATDTWNEFIPAGREDLESIKSYVYLRVKLIFDPPTNAAALEAIKEQIKELGWRLNVAAESTHNTEGEEEI